ncbi:unnamed protein product [Phaeothamnion confervicola]
MQGWRVEMEDAHTIVPGIAGLRDHSFVAVYDGHGGAFSAKFAGEHMLRILQEAPPFRAYVEAPPAKRRPELLEQAMRDAFLTADEELRKQPAIRDNADRSGCTAIAAIVSPTHVVVAHSGDSRAVFCSGGRAVARTNDHKPYNEGEKSRIERAGGCVSMKRVDGDLAVSRALGDFQYKDAAMRPEDCKVTAWPDTLQKQRNGENDQLLVVACDGIWDVMDDHEALTCIMEILSEGESSVGRVCEELLDQCLFKGSRDNMSAIIVAFPGWSPSATGGGVEARRKRRAEDAAKEERKAAAMNGGSDEEYDPDRVVGSAAQA